MREVEVSVVMPCLNEAETIGACIKKAKIALKTYIPQHHVEIF